MNQTVNICIANIFSDQLVTSAPVLGKYVLSLDMSELTVGIIPKVSTVQL